MAINTYTHRLSLAAGVSGNISITGVGFTPTLLKVIGLAPFNEPPIAGNYRTVIGAATGGGSAEQFCYATYSVSGVSTSDSMRSGERGCISFLLNAGDTKSEKIEFVSFDADGYTINIPVALGVDVNLNVVLLDPPDVEVSFLTVPNVSGNVSKTGMTFAPTAIELYPFYNATEGEVNSSSMWTFGAGDVTGNQFSISIVGADVATPTVTKRYQTSGSICNSVSSSASGIILSTYTLVSLNSDGFTLGTSSPVGGTQDFFYIAYGVENARISTFAQPTSDISTTITGTGFSPDTVFFYGIQNPTFDDATLSDARLITGVGSEMAQSANSVWDDDNQSSSVVSRVYSGAFAIVQHASIDDPINQPWASYVSSDVDGFTLDWSYTDTIGRNTFYLALQDDSTPPVTTGQLESEGFTRLDTYATNAANTGLKVPSLGVGVTAANVPLLIKASDLTDNQKNNLKADWGDLRISTDLAGNNQLPLDIVEGGSIAWTRVPNVAADEVIYVWGNKPAAVKEGNADTFGRNAVYQDYLAVLALNDTGWEDLTGNGHTATLEGSGVTVTTANHPYGDKWALFTGSGRLRLASSNGLISGGAKAVSVWSRRSNTTNNQGIVSSRTTSGPTNEFQITARSATTNYFMMVNDGVSQVSGGVSPTPAANVNERLTLTWDATSASTRYNANEDLTGSLTDGNLASSNDIVIGDYNNLNFSEAFEGYAGDVWIKNSYKTLNEESIEYQNQSANDAWWIAEDAGGATNDAEFASVNTSDSTLDGFVRLLGGFTSTNISTSTLTASALVLDAAFSSVNTSTSSLDGNPRLSGSMASSNNSSSEADGKVRLSGTFTSVNTVQTIVSFGTTIATGGFSSVNPFDSALDGNARLSTGFTSSVTSDSNANGFVRLISGFDSVASSDSELDGLIRLIGEFESTNNSFSYLNGIVNGIINPSEPPLYINLTSTVIDVNLVRIPYEIELEG